MGVRNYLIEGLSGTGKTAVADELNRRGIHAVHGDRELAYQGNPETGERTVGMSHAHHIWDVERVTRIASQRIEPITFFCGGSRNFPRFIDIFDAVFVLDVDLDTLLSRLAARPAEEYGGTADELNHVVRLHHTIEDLPTTGLVIDASQPIQRVVDTILRTVGVAGPLGHW